MRSQDRTLLANLGFADQDKKNPLHDKACYYLATPKVSTELAGSLIVDEKFRVKGNAKTEIEHPLSKGNGQYKTTIGFIDVLIQQEIEHSPDGCRWHMHSIEEVAVEVKIIPVSISESIRQIKLYREYIEYSWRFVLVTSWTPDESEKAALRNERIYHRKLGDGFKQWQKEESSGRPCISVEI